MGAHSSKEIDMARPVIVPARVKHTASLIFLHGLGDTGDGWALGFKQFNFANVRCVCPNAPSQPVSLNGGVKMPSWYNIYELNASSKEDEAGIKKAALTVQEAIAEEEKLGIPSDNIFLGGFSQGGALALYTAFTCGKPLAGVIALSTYLPLRNLFPKCINANEKVPLFQAHGLQDPLIPQMWGKMTHSFINHFNPNSTIKFYSDLKHGSCEGEMSDVKDFVLAQLAKK